MIWNELTQTLLNDYYHIDCWLGSPFAFHRSIVCFESDPWLRGQLSMEMWDPSLLAVRNLIVVWAVSWLVPGTVYLMYGMDNFQEIQNMIFEQTLPSPILFWPHYSLQMVGVCSRGHVQNFFLILHPFANSLPRGMVCDVRPVPQGHQSCSKSKTEGRAIGCQKAETCQENQGTSNSCWGVRTGSWACAEGQKQIQTQKDWLDLFWHGTIYYGSH